MLTSSIIMASGDELSSPPERLKYYFDEILKNLRQPKVIWD